MKDIFTILFRGRKVLLGRDFYQRRQLKRKRMKFGNRFADWTFCPDSINDESVIYSFGVGGDISFDLLLMKHFNLKVHAFDPSPGSIAWIEKQDLPEGFNFHPYGLAATDGEIAFAEPTEPGVHSLFATDYGEKSTEGLKQHILPVHRLPTIVKNLGHSKIDILKMDIEGAEYEVIEDIITLQQPVKQVLIEFHHRFQHLGLNRTREAVIRMNQAGYRIFHVSASGEEFSFIKTDS
jgi:FkbM family methyltransferase